MIYEDPTTGAGLRSLQGSLQQYNRLPQCQGGFYSSMHERLDDLAREDGRASAFA